MAALVKEMKPRFVRWFKEFKKNNRSPSKWYEHEHYGVHGRISASRAKAEARGAWHPVGYGPLAGAGGQPFIWDFGY